MSWKALNEAKVFLLFLGVGILIFTLWKYWLGVALLSLVSLGVALFFRDPHRTITDDPTAIVSPADGTVDAIENLPHIEALQGPGKRVSIFLSVLDVHINRVPYEGTIRSISYHPGRFLDARHVESAQLNENQLWILETSHGTIGVRQIAGLIARRIVGWRKQGDEVKTGQRLGLIKFGSRTDLYLPLYTKVQVQIGQKVKGGATIIAQWTQSL
ncbi:MAG: phosphatidylserine decarboxylase family protein [Verrucomicrobiae bacterium]|nr:phosphatidylserine decarboxylase family protein [Verrucomicrobiae bacterium]